MEHPPFVRMWAALPLLVTPGIRLDTGSRSWLRGPQWQFCHEFMYRANDADRMLYRARFMLALLGVLVGALLFCWAQDWYGAWPAAVVLALYCLEPNLMAHAGLVTSDFGLVCFGFGSVYFVWRSMRRFSVFNLFGALTLFALAQVTKFSAVLLVPVALGVVLLCGWQERRWWRAVGVFLGLLVATYLAIWSVYGFRYERTPKPAADFQFGFDIDARIPRASPILQHVTSWVCRHRLLPEAYAQGFLLGQAKAGERAGYLAGRHSVTGWWYYFPVAFLVKTPLTVVLFGMAGVASCAVRWREKVGREWIAVWPVVVFLGVAMSANINIGLRHILVIYPFLLLLAGGVVAALWNGRKRALVVGGLALALVEFAVVYPNCLAAFNLAVGGPARGEHYLVDSNLDWGQDLKGLKRWMERQGVGHVNLSYFGTADPAYYGIDCTYLPGSPYFAEPQVRLPRLPGYVAVSVTNLHGAYFTAEGRRTFEPLLSRRPVATIGRSIHVFWMDHAWW
jgi:4-amino-4-deoxy-L-arabinose transferase-like glycosyltransferase